LTVSVAAGAQKVNPKDPATIPRITQTGFQPLQAEGKVLALDVRDKTSFDAGRVPGAINVPLAEVEKRIDEIKTKAEGRPIVAYCSCPSEHTAAEAGLILYKNGVTDVRVLIGGYPDWVRFGGKIER
jgi:rhodanese-related sulfurtransferase